MIKYLAKFERWSFGVHYLHLKNVGPILLIIQHEVTPLFLLMFAIKHKKTPFLNKHFPNSTKKPARRSRYHTAARHRASPRKVLHQTIFKTWQVCNADLSSVMSYDIHLRAISRETPKPFITKIALKITQLISHFNLPGANELMRLHYTNSVYFNGLVQTYWRCISQFCTKSLIYNKALLILL